MEYGSSLRAAAPSADVIAASAERTRLVNATVGAVLFREVLAPLAAGLGPVASTALDSVADRVFPVRLP
jgi:uncharacterized protein (DUF4213/DUF364 family)